jgi:hydrogenase maturation protease
MGSKKILIYGYGNPGRQDDGLGVHFAQRIEEWVIEKKYSHIRVESNYQLNIEDAAEISTEDLVIFADASLEEMVQYKLVELQPSATVEFTMHAVHPAFVLHLCDSIYGKIPRALIMHLKGYSWELQEGLTPEATQNLEAAFNFLVSSGELNP